MVESQKATKEESDKYMQQIKYYKDHLKPLENKNEENKESDELNDFDKKNRSV